MKALKTAQRWFRLGNAKTPAGRALLIEQFRILTSQIPVLYGVLIIDSISLAYVLQPLLARWFRFGVPGALLLISTVRMLYRIKLRFAAPTAAQALQHIYNTRIQA